MGSNLGVPGSLLGGKVIEMATGMQLTSAGWAGGGHSRQETLQD